MNFRAKTVKESIVETVHIIRPSDLNDAGRLFGGVLMQWIDEVAALVAKRHSQISKRCYRYYWKSYACRTYFYGGKSRNLCREYGRGKSIN